MFAAWDSIPARKVQTRCAKGIPDRVRGEAWKRLSGSHTARAANPTLYKTLLKTVPDGKDVVQIDLDIKRAHQEHEFFRGDYEEGQLLLFNVLRAYSKHDTEIGYTQGMSDIGGILLMYVLEEDAFWMLVQLMHSPKYEMHGMFENNFPTLFRVVYIQEALMKEKVPKLHEHMAETLGIDMKIPHSYTMEWYMLLCVRVLPFETTLRVLDVVMCHGFHVMLSIGLALFKVMEQKLLDIKDDSTLLQTLKSPGGLVVNVSADTLVSLATETGLYVSFRTYEKLSHEYNKLKQASKPKK